ncbi:aspartate/glutamate racemase family protein [Streptomyces sp. NBC_01022]|uniref:aspartate/glutamate racemase family protein n=1 Tax=Streptomyces sp. NBC_01022 TaxID=2903723 RepID=UPI002DD8512B|nr:amino acid racemase [Streptomyces sp. NBC_01022]WRZ80202.1 amino acid racemase [Streptomyces sp. NBC_01022]
MPTRWKKVGIVGGLGPLACAYFYTRLVELTQADSDSGHPEVMLLSSPDVPSRLAHLLEGGPSPVPALQRVARRLERAGSEVIAVPSLTTQAYLDEIASAVAVPVIGMLTAVAEQLRDAGIHRPALAVTDGARRAGRLHQALTEAGLAPVYPDQQDQARIQECLRLVKAGRSGTARAEFRSLTSASWAAAGDAFVIGCTDLSPLLSGLPPDCHDVGDLYARAVLVEAATP